MGNVIVGAIIGVIGILLGALLNEVLRRRNRIEGFSSTVFGKRLSVYEELFRKIQIAYGAATDVIENPNYTDEQRKDIVSTVILDIAHFCDENGLFIDTDLGAHCIAMLMGVEDIFAMTDEVEKQKAIRNFTSDYINAKRMILEDSGVEQINKLFKSITKPSLNSPVINYIKYLREEKRKQEANEKRFI